MGCCTSHHHPSPVPCITIKPKEHHIDSTLLRKQSLGVIAQVTTPITTLRQMCILKALVAPTLNLQDNQLYQRRKSTTKDSPSQVGTSE